MHILTIYRTVRLWVYCLLCTQYRKESLRNIIYVVDCHYPGILAQNLYGEVIGDGLHPVTESLPEGRRYIWCLSLSIATSTVERPVIENMSIWSEVSITPPRNVDNKNLRLKVSAAKTPAPFCAQVPGIDYHAWLSYGCSYRSGR